MPSQLEILKKDLADLEPKFGPDNPFVQGLKMQLAMYEKPRAENPVDNGPVHLGGRGDNPDGT